VNRLWLFDEYGIDYLLELGDFLLFEADLPRLPNASVCCAQFSALRTLSLS
jgi:hypothetical protein